MLAPHSVFYQKQVHPQRRRSKQFPLCVIHPIEYRLVSSLVYRNMHKQLERKHRPESNMRATCAFNAVIYINLYCTVDKLFASFSGESFGALLGDWQFLSFVGSQ